MTKEVVTVREVQEMLNVSRGTVERMLANKKLPFVRTERLRLIPLSAIKDFIAGR